MDQASEHPALASWVALNEALMTGDLTLATQLLEAERQGKARKQFMLRIHSRVNKLRADAERAALLAEVKS